jgi:hypothetical protein
MMLDNREAVFNGGPFQSYWWADEHEPIHPAIKAELKCAVNADILAKAWERTMRVYPLLDLIPDDYDEEVVFYKSEGKSRPVQSKASLQLVKDVTLYRGVSLTYYENTVTLSAYHSLVDEKGLTEVFKTLLNFYISETENVAADAANVMMKENRQPQEYYIQNTMLNPADYNPQPVKLYKDIREIFTDTDVVGDEGCAVTSGEVEISAKDFDMLCEKAGLSDDELFTYVMAKSVYDMYPQERRKLSFGIMTDFRTVFDVSDTIAPCSKKMPLVLSHDDICGGDLNAAAKKISEIRAHQKSADYIKSHVAMENTYSVLNIKNACLSINYAGSFDIGEKTEYIKNITMTDYSMRAVFMMRLGDTVKADFQYGSATGKYMDVIVKTFGKLGVQAKVTVKPYPVYAESDKPTV